MIKISNLSDTPRYSIKEVTKKTGILSVTLRAWERRYQFSIPKRGPNRYRLYSDQDIGILLWVKQQVSRGISISIVASQLRTFLIQGNLPDIENDGSKHLSSLPSEHPANYIKNLFTALMKHDERVSLQIINTAKKDLGIQVLAIEVLTPLLVMIGEAWHRGEIRIIDEHSASSLIRGWINSILLENVKTNRNLETIIGCAPTELHEIGSMIMALLVRNMGYSVEYLGCDVPIEDIIAYTADVHPKLVILSATMTSSVRELSNLQEKISGVSPKTLFGFGGRAFNQMPELRASIDGLFLGDTFIESMDRIRTVLK
jgi:methanogenic corrinoid protein MtbC1